MRGRFNAGKFYRGVCYVGYYRKELAIRSFQILTIQPSWYKVSGRPSRSLINAAEGTGNMRVCRVNRYSRYIPGKLYIGRRGPVCYYGFGRRELFMRTNYEIMLKHKACWVWSRNRSVPAHAIAGGYNRARKPQVVVRAKFRG